MHNELEDEVVEAQSVPRGPVEVLATSDVTRLMVAESLLRWAGIRYRTQHEGPNDPLGLERVGAGYSPLVGKQVLLVEPGRVGEARALLETADDEVR